MLVLGLPSFHHSGWGLVKDGKPIRAIQEERLNRIKHYPYYTDTKEHPMQLGLDYLFKGLNHSVEDCDAATIPMMPNGEEYHDMQYLVVDSIDEVISKGLKNNYNNVLSFIKSKGFKGKVVFVNHQLSHAAYAYNFSGYEKTDVISYDGAGCGFPPEVVVGFSVDNHNYEKLFSYNVPHSLGHIYSNTTNRIFGDRSDGCEGKVMGLAPYGKNNPDYTMLVLDKKNDMYVATYPNTTKMFYPGVEPYNSKFGLRQGMITQRENKKKWDFDDPKDMFYVDLAATAQSSVEAAGIHYVKKLKNISGNENLCITGGVALNSCLNGLIRRTSIYSSTFAAPACHDGGHGLGAPLFYCNLVKKNKDFKRVTSDFFGYPYSDDDCIQAADELGVSYEKFDTLDDLGSDIADSLIDQKIIAVFNEGSEFGPRALGHRSIMVDPRTAEMKDTLNARVKFREGYRPFAPIVLKEHAAEYFEFDDSDFMLFVAKATERAKKEVPAVIHVDGTARMQTVGSDNEPFYSTLKNFYDKTGTAVLLNTSFNVAGEPIVETPQDAIRCFLGTSIDILYLNKIKITKS
jgi:carbamoyltransferase